MRLQGWLIAALMACPALVRAQALTEADLVGGWRAEAEHVDDLEEGRPRGWLVLWLDHLWGYGGPILQFAHGGVRWRLVGDTLWLGNDFGPYFHYMIEPRTYALQANGRGIGVVDRDVIARGRVGKGGAFSQPDSIYVPDSAYWSEVFRNSTTWCSYYGPHTQCGTWVYKVTKQGANILSLVRIDSLSIATSGTPPTMVLKRDSLTNCPQYKDGDGGLDPDAWNRLYSEGCPAD